MSLSNIFEKNDFNIFAESVDADIVGSNDGTLKLGYGQANTVRIGLPSTQVYINDILYTVGNIGPQGPTGATGSPGMNGVTGERGATGEQGVTGSTGERGATGEKGEQGYSSGALYAMNYDINSDVVGYKDLNRIESISAQTSITNVVTAGSPQIFSKFITPIGDPNQNYLIGSAWDVTAWASRGVGGGSVTLTTEIYKADNTGTSFTLLASSVPVLITGSIPTVYNYNIGVPYTVLNITDRIAVHNKISVSAGSISVSLFYNDSTVGEILTSLNNSAGPTGPIGPTGPAGINGTNGTNGANGATGAQGIQGPAGSADAWSRTGNAGTVSGTNFLGTTDNQNLLVKINNTDSFRFTNKKQLEILNSSQNVLIGESAGNSFGGGFQNVGVGYASLVNSNSNFCTGVGGESLLQSNAQYNTCVGFRSGYTITSGGQNICIGYSHNTLTTGTGNILIGNAIGTQTAGESNTCRIQRIRGTTTINADAINVVISSTGQLGTVSSRRDLKTEIALMDDTTNLIEQLKPSTFKYKCHCYAECKDVCCCEDLEDGQVCEHGCKCLDESARTCGLIAEDVFEVIPQLTVNDKDGNLETIRYHLLPIYMLRAQQEQIKKVKSLEERIARLENIIYKLNG